jgi:hypothetical protein
MPLERRSGTQQLVAIGVGVLAVALAVGLAWGLLALASGGDGPVRLQLGDDEFNAGQAARLSAQIGEDGPVLFSDVSGRGQRRPLMVNHFGDDPEIRWVAFNATAPGADEGCFVSWSEERELFEERAARDGAGRERGELCRDVTYPPTGEGLEQYSWSIDEDGNLLIDLRGDDDPGGDGEDSGS